MSTRPAPVAESLAVTPTRKHTQAAPTSASLRRVHFSPCNEEIPVGETPQSSPTRAQMRPRTRGILKRHSSAALTEQLPSSDIDQPDGASGLDALLSSPLRVSARGVEGLAGSVLQFADRASASDLAFGEAFAQAIDSLRGRDAADGVLPQLYNGLCGLIAKNAQQAGAALEQAMELLEYIQRDIADPASPKQTALAATKCLGCALHIEAICTGAAAADKLCGPLEAMVEQVQRQASPDKSVCQAAVWCAGMVRAPAAAIKPAIPGLVQLCVTVMARFGSSTTAQFECLTALEALLRRAPGATRQVYRAWLFPVLGLVANPVTGVRAKAGSIIRQNIPWVAADVHGPDMDALVKDFIATRLDQILTSATRLLGHGEHVLVARIWGMVIAVCARHCRGRLNDLLRVIQECFNSPSADVLVAALMQWRCLIYAFVLESRIHLHKCVQLVLTPIIKILEMTGTGTDVRLACVRCWVTLVYALGEEIGSHIDIISRVAGLVADDPCHEVRAVAARVLAALFNKFALAETSVAQFVIPRMVIGTTMLAASDGKSLSDTHGPFSSEVAYGGDHTLVLCKYVTGLGAGSPTVPVVADTAIRFIQQYMLAERRAAESCDPSTDRQSSLQRGFRSCGALCWGLAAAIRALGPTAAPQQRQLTVAITRAFVATLASDRACDPTPDPRYVCDYDCSPHALLYAALVDHLGDVLRQTRVDASELLCTACDPASAGAGHTCSALPVPCPPLAPTCFVALTGCHALWLGLQVRALANSESEDRRDAAAEDRLDAAAEAAAGHVRRLLPDRRDPDIGDSAATDDALVAMVVGSLIDAGSQPSAMRLALVQMFSRAADALRAAPSSPHAPFVLKAALFSGADGRDPELQRAREQALARLGAAASGPAFWPSALNALVDWVLDDQHLPGVYDLRLVYALCNGRGSKPDDIWDAKCCLGLATVVFGLEFGLPAADNADESVQELARTVRRETRDASNGLLQRLHSLLLPLVRAAVERIASDHADDTVRRARRNATAFVLAVVRGSTIKLTLTGDMPRDMEEEELDPTPEPEPMSESAREVAAAAERIVWACCAHQVAEPDTASVAPAEATPADGSALRKRTHLPESSDDDDGDDDRAPATEPAQTPPQRRRRKKRGKRRAPVSRSGSLSPSPSGVDDAEPDQLQAALDQLEATLHTAPPCSISRLLAVQARITGMQLWLCDAMRQGLDGA